MLIVKILTNAEGADVQAALVDSETDATVARGQLVVDLDGDLPAGTNVDVSVKFVGKIGS
jgi:hypothetical protein